MLGSAETRLYGLFGVRLALVYWCRAERAVTCGGKSEVARTVAIDPQTMIVCLLRQFLLGVIMRLVHQFRVGPNLSEVDGDCVRLGVIGRWNV